MERSLLMTDIAGFKLNLLPIFGDATTAFLIVIILQFSSPIQLVSR